MYPNSPGCPRAMAMQASPMPRQPGAVPQTMPPRNCLMYPYAPGCPMAAPPVPTALPLMQTPSMPMQTVASNTLTLPMGVTLEGRGTVVAVEPGSPAERAGIQVGDLINRINGK